MPREATEAQSVTVQGLEVPKLGLGTWQITGDDCVEAVRDALELGYRHLDTAAMYENEVQVARGIAESGVDRDDIWLTTKIPHTEAGADRVGRRTEVSLRRLGTDHVDLLLLHWPAEDVPLEETMAALAEQRDAGRARAIGVSNFPSDLLRRALELAPVACDQVEYHPYLGQPHVLEMAREHDLLVTAYSPFAHGGLLRDPVLREIADEHDRTPAQIALRWLLDQPNVAAIPKASSHERRAENLAVFDFDLTDAQRGRIAGLERGERTIDPSWAPDWD